MKGFNFKNSYKFLSSNMFKTTTFGVITFASSCLSATYGIGKFFVTSRLKLVKDWSLGGVLLFMCFSSAFILRLFYTEMVFFAFNYDTGWLSHSLIPRLAIYLMWGIPSFLFNLTKLLATGGIDKTWKLLSFYPQVLLAPCFIFFTFEWCGDERGLNSNCVDENDNVQKKPENNNDVQLSGTYSPKTIGFRVWTVGSIVNAIYMLLIPSVFVIFVTPVDGLIPFHVTPEWRGMIVFSFYVLPIYIAFLIMLAMHLYGDIIFNALFFHNSFLEKYIKKSHFFDPDLDIKFT